MSHIIECPACSTRYKMSKPIPEGGRYVKCARCGHQWRVVPEDDAEATLERDPSEYNPDAGADEQTFVGSTGDHEQYEDSGEWRQSEEQAAAFADEAGIPEQQEYGEEWSQGAEETAEEAQPDSGEEISPWQERRDHFGATISTLSDAHAVDYGSAEEDPPAEPAPVKQSWWARFREGRERRESPPAEPISETRRPLFTGSFDSTVATDESQDSGLSEETGEVLAASRTKWTDHLRSWKDDVETTADDGEDDAESAETAIREALKAALEEPREETQGSVFSQARYGAELPGGKANKRWTPFGGSSFGSDRKSAFDKESERAETSELAEEDFTAQTTGVSTDQDDEPPFRLTGRSARTPIFGTRDETGQFGEEESTGIAFQHDIEDTFSADSAVDARSQAHDDQPRSEFDSLYDDQFVQEAEGHAVDDFERGAAALQAELESTDVTRYDVNRSRGGLATAAAWAVFFSVVSGVALAFVGLREDIMAALPGTTGLYRSLGFQVADAGIDFADVSYRWTTSDGKPMIEVTGQVVNITDRTVPVPRVLINVRDANSTDSVKATANVPTDKLAPRQSANFTLEFLSPPKNVNQIELEFDRSR